MKDLRRNSAAGFTLVELLIGATLSAAVMAAVFSSYIYLGRNLARLANQQTLETQARRTLGQFTQDAQSASGFSGVPSATSVAFRVPTPVKIAGPDGILGTSDDVVTGTMRENIVTYYYNNLSISSSEADDATINSTTVSMPRQALTRCVYDGTTVTSVTLLRNITDNDPSTAYDLFIRYFDAGGNAYDNGASPYTTIPNYTSSIRQISLQFDTQTGVAGNGTRTLVYQVASGRLVLRNRVSLQ